MRHADEQTFDNATNPPWVNMGEQTRSADARGRDGIYGLHGMQEKSSAAHSRARAAAEGAFAPGQTGVVSSGAPGPCNTSPKSPRLAAAARAALVNGHHGSGHDGHTEKHTGQGWQQWMAGGGGEGAASATAAADAAAVAAAPIGIYPDMDLGQGHRARLQYHGACGAVRSSGGQRPAANNPGGWEEDSAGEALSLSFSQPTPGVCAPAVLDRQLAVGSTLRQDQDRVGYDVVQGHHAPRPVVSDAAHRTQAALQAEMEGGGRGQAAATGPQQLPYGMKPANGLSPRPAAVIRPF